MDAEGRVARAHLGMVGMVREDWLRCCAVIDKIYMILIDKSLCLVYTMYHSTF